VATNGRRYRVGGNRSSRKASTRPRAKLPLMLVQNVPQGNVPGVMWTASEIPYRAGAPSAPPTATAAGTDRLGLDQRRPPPNFPPTASSAPTGHFFG